VRIDRLLLVFIFGIILLPRTFQRLGFDLGWAKPLAAEPGTPYFNHIILPVALLYVFLRVSGALRRQ